MIRAYDGTKLAVEEAVARAYKDLTTYAQSPKANPKAVEVRRRMLDTFADGWNQQESLIDDLCTEIEILKAKLKTQRLPYRGSLNRPATIFDLNVMLAQALNENRTLRDLSKRDQLTFSQTDWRKESPYSAARERIRAERLEQVQATWPELY